VLPARLCTCDCVIKTQEYGTYRGIRAWSRPRYRTTRASYNIVPTCMGIYVYVARATLPARP